MIGMLRDARTLPRRFWEAYGIALVFVFVSAYGISTTAGWFVALVLLVTAWGLFSALIVAYRMGMVAAYRDAAEWAEEARRALNEGQAELEEIQRRYGALGKHFEGPS